MKIFEIILLKRILVIGILIIPFFSVAQENGSKGTDVREKDFECILLIEPQATLNSGDLHTFQQWVTEHIIYPPEAIDKNISGEVIADFYVNSIGQICKITIVKKRGFVT